MLNKKLTTMKNSEELKKIVKDKYADIAMAPKTAGCCCSDDDCVDYSVFSESYAAQPGYVKEADMGLGCGLPTEHANISEGDSVLDLGSGAGNDCFVARSIVGESGKVTGLDFTDEMLVKANINKDKLGYKNVDFVKGDIEAMPLPDSAYDVVISNCVLNLVPDKEKAFKEIRRVLNADGHFCISDVVLKGELPDELREAATLYAGCVSGALQKEAYLKVIEDAGFRNIEIKKEREIDVPDSLLQPYVSREKLEAYRKTGTGIYSITVVAEKG
jgi:SAM-dependent methyltransferase